MSKNARKRFFCVFRGISAVIVRFFLDFWRIFKNQNGTVKKKEGKVTYLFKAAIIRLKNTGETSGCLVHPGEGESYQTVPWKPEKHFSFPSNERESVDPSETTPDYPLGGPPMLILWEKDYPGFTQVT